MNPNIKKFIIWSAVVAVLIIGITGGWVAYQSHKEEKEKRRETLFPSLNTPNISPAIVGEEYNYKLIASIIGDNVKMNMEIEELPDGFTLTDCKTQYNVEVMKKPNTLHTCKLKGKSEEVLYKMLLVTVYGEDYLNRLQYEVPFTVLEELPE